MSRGTQAGCQQSRDSCLEVICASFQMDRTLGEVNSNVCSVPGVCSRTKRGMPDHCMLFLSRRDLWANGLMYGRRRKASGVSIYRPKIIIVCFGSVDGFSGALLIL